MIDYIMLVVGVILAIGLAYIFYRNYRYSSKYNFALLSIDTLAGIIAGVYLMVISLRLIF